MACAKDKISLRYSLRKETARAVRMARDKLGLRYDSDFMQRLLQAHEEGDARKANRLGRFLREAEKLTKKNKGE